MEIDYSYLAQPYVNEVRWCFYHSDDLDLIERKIKGYKSLKDVSRDSCLLSPSTILLAKESGMIYKDEKGYWQLRP